MANGPFSISTGNMDRFKLLMRVLNGCTEGNGIINIFLVSCCADPAEHRQATVKKFNGSLIIHFRKGIKRAAMTGAMAALTI